jgi:hypothetical protein
MASGYGLAGGTYELPLRGGIGGAGGGEATTMARTDATATTTMNYDYGSGE